MSSAATYLVPARGGTLHLSIFVYDEDGFHGHRVPLCGQDRGRRWTITGPWAERWPTQSRWRMCSRCHDKVLDLLDDEASA